MATDGSFVRRFRMYLAGKGDVGLGTLIQDCLYPREPPYLAIKALDAMAGKGEVVCTEKDDGFF